VIANDGPESALAAKADALLADLAGGLGRRAPGAPGRRY